MDADTDTFRSSFRSFCSSADVSSWFSFIFSSIKFRSSLEIILYVHFAVRASFILPVCLYLLINDDTLLRDVFTPSSSSSLTMFTIVLFQAYNEIIRFLVYCESFPISNICKAWPSNIDTRFNLVFELAGSLN